MSSAVQTSPPQSPGWERSARFVVISVILHVALAFLLIGQYGYGTAGRFTEVTLTSVSVPSESPPAEKAEEAAPDAPPAVTEPDPVVVPEEAAPEEPVEEAMPEPQPEPQPEEAGAAPAVAAAEQRSNGAFGFICTHPHLAENRLPAPYDGMLPFTEALSYLGYPPGYEQEQFSGGRYAMFGQRGGPTIKWFARPYMPQREGEGGEGALVVLALRIDSYGRVTGLSVLESAGYDLDTAAVDSVRRSMFGPAVVDGRPVDCIALLPIRFGPAGTAGQTPGT